MPRHPSPRTALIDAYKNTLSVLEKIPQESVYKVTIQPIIQARLAFVETKTSADADLFVNSEEQDQALGQLGGWGRMPLEQVIVQAEDEARVAQSIFEQKSWEKLEEVPVPGQWTYFK